jgi:GT2 family glycosyltransferase
VQDLPFVSIIIVNYNGEKILERCLSAVFKTEYLFYEVIIVDNNSSDNSIGMVREQFPKCKIISMKENMGFAIPNNVGASQSRGAFLAFLNNDTVVTPTWLKELVQVMERDPDVAICQSLLLKPDGDVDSSGDFATRFGRTYSSKKSGFTEPREILSAKGAAMLVRRDYFLEVGGFDPDYFITFEDVEIGWKTWIRGLKVVMVPTSVVCHSPNTTIKTMNSMSTFNGLKNQLSLVTTHFESGIAIRNLIVICAFLFIDLIKLLIRIGIRNDSLSIEKKMAIKAGLWYLRNFLCIWKKHGQVNLVRKYSTNDLMCRRLITKYVNEN